MTNPKLFGALLSLAMALPAAQAPAASISQARAIFDLAGPSDTDLIVNLKQGRSGTGERGRDRDRSGDDGPSHERHSGHDDGPSHERHNGDDHGRHHETEVHRTGSDHNRGSFVWGPGCDGGGDRDRDRDGDDHRERGDDGSPERRRNDHSGGGNHGGNAFLSAPTAPIATMNITKPDGTRERLVNGQYERCDLQGRLVERRQATGSDVLSLRLDAMNPGAQVAPSQQGGGQSRPTRVHIRGGDVSVLYSNGWTEAVTQGRIRMTDRYENMAIDRAATFVDTTRLRSLDGL